MCAFFKTTKTVFAKNVCLKKYFCRLECPNSFRPSSSTVYILIFIFCCCNCGGRCTNVQNKPILTNWSAVKRYISCMCISVKRDANTNNNGWLSQWCCANAEKQLMSMQKSVWKFQNHYKKRVNHFRRRSGSLFAF